MRIRKDPPASSRVAGPLTLIPRGVEWVGPGQVVDDDRHSGIGAVVSVANGLCQVPATGDDVVTVEAEADRGDIGWAVTTGHGEPGDGLTG